MKQVLIKRGKTIVADVPAPLVELGQVLAGGTYLLISAGTEVSGIHISGKSICMCSRRSRELGRQGHLSGESDGLEPGGTGSVGGRVEIGVPCFTQANVRLVLTDSCDIQEETTILGVPCGRFAPSESEGLRVNST